MKNLRPFQIAVLGVFALLAVLAVVLISNFRPAGDEFTNQYGDRVIVWGSLDPSAFDEVFSIIRDNDKNFSAVEYYDIDPRNFENQLVNAIAEGRSPDLILLPHDQLVTLRAKLTPISYETLSMRDFRDRYVDGAEIFARPDGVYALPIMVDPLVLYWNRDLFASNGLAQAPTTWEQLVGTTLPALTVRDTSRNILRSAIAFGEFRNVENAGAVLSMLLLQSGSRMVEEGDRGYVVALNESIGGTGRPPMEAATQFYTDFSNSNSPAYSWNRSQPRDLDAFVAGDLAMYFGFGSEVLGIADRNPNLNFDVASVPQGAGANTKRTYGQFYGLAIPLAAQNRGGGFAAANTLTRPEYAAYLANELQLAPVHRGVLAGGSDDAFTAVVYRAALIAQGWLDPDPATTAGILQTMVEDIVSNRARVSAAVTDAVNRITLSF